MSFDTAMKVETYTVCPVTTAGFAPAMTCPPGTTVQTRRPVGSYADSVLASEALAVTKICAPSTTGRSRCTAPVPGTGGVRRHRRAPVVASKATS